MKNAVSTSAVLRWAALGTAAVLSAACATQKPAAKPLPPPSMTASAAPAPAAPAPAPAAAADSAPAPATTFAKERAGLKVHRLFGSVDSIDASAGTLVVKEKDGKTHAFQVLSDTKLDKGGADAAIKLSSVRAGDRVRVSYVKGFAGQIHVLVASAATHG